MSEPQHSAEDWLHEVGKRMQDEKQSGTAIRAEILTVREFLAKFGKARRGHWVVSDIRHKLDIHHLRTSPDFQFQFIDSPISIELDDDMETEDDEEESASPTVRIDSLTAAHNKPVFVAPDDAIVLAITHMWMKGFSQLPVMTTEREVKGVISWRSIGKAYANGRTPDRVRECMEESHEIGIMATFTDATHEIWKHDYVLVRGEDKKITGILTAADLAYQFEQLAHPFLLIGEIEHRLRNLVRGKFTVTILRTVFKQCYWRWLHSHKGPGTEGLNFSKLYPWAKCREIRSSRCWLKVWPLQTDHSRPWQGFTVLLTRFQFTQGESTR